MRQASTFCMPLGAIFKFKLLVVLPEHDITEQDCTAIMSEDFRQSISTFCISLFVQTPQKMPLS